MLVIAFNALLHVLLRGHGLHTWFQDVFAHALHLLALFVQGVQVEDQMGVVGIMAQDVRFQRSTTHGFFQVVRTGIDVLIPRIRFRKIRATDRA